MDDAIVSKHLSEVVAGGFDACDYSENNQRYLLVRKLPTISKDWNLSEADILISIPSNYPVGGLDAFYVDKNLELSNEQKHKRMASGHCLIKRQWWLVSWHYTDNKPWASQHDTLLTHIYHCQKFLIQGARAD